MTLFVILITSIFIFVLLFSIMWGLSDGADLKKSSNSKMEFKDNFFWYLAAIIMTTSLFIIVNLNSKIAEIKWMDLPLMCVGPVLLVSPPAKRMYCAMIRFLLRQSS